MAEPATLDHAIRDQIADDVTQIKGSESETFDAYAADRLGGALLAVLDLHAPIAEPPFLPDSKPLPNARMVCSAETHVWGSMNDYTDYPCDTVLAIADKLGVSAA